MPTYKQTIYTQKFWSTIRERDTYHLTTTNAVIRYNGCLAMGAGHARQMAMRFPQISREFGALIQQITMGDHEAPYGVVWHGCLGAFQTKGAFWNKSTLPLIENSVQSLLKHDRIDDAVFNLPFPGIGLGGLRCEDVMPLLEPLPDNVVVWELV